LILTITTGFLMNLASPKYSFLSMTVIRHFQMNPFLVIRQGFHIVLKIYALASYMMAVVKVRKEAFVSNSFALRVAKLIIDGLPIAAVCVEILTLPLPHMFHNRRYGENAFFSWAFFSLLLLPVDNFSSISFIEAFWNRLIPICFFRNTHPTWRPGRTHCIAAPCQKRGCCPRRGAKKSYHTFFILCQFCPQCPLFCPE